MLYQFIKERTVLSALLLAMAAVSCVSAIAESAAHSTPTNQVIVAAKGSASFGGSSTVSLTLPSDVDRSTIHAMLNGKDISDRLIATDCKQGTCLTATVSSVDGLRMGKNVVYATAHTEQGRLVTGRARFLQSAMPQTSGGRKMFANGLRANADDNSGPSAFLPPTVTFQTLYSGGWTGATPWFQVGDQQYPTTAPCGSGTVYLVLAFDRQTLAPVFGNGGGCESTGTDLASALTKIPANDLVVVGTLSGEGSDALLDTSSIGGTNHTNAKNQPAGYVAIGVAGATSGAYENYAVDPKGDNTLATPMWPFATGIVQEDQDGNYNYESSDVLEYWADPFTTDNSGDPSGVVTVAASALQASQNPSVKAYRYAPPPLNGMTGGGYWLLVVRRDLPSSPLNSANFPCSTVPSPVDSNGIVRYTNCGKIYNTGNGANASGAYQALATDMNQVGPYDLAFLMAFQGTGYPVCCGDPWIFTGNNLWYDNASGPSNSYYYFRNVLEEHGGSGRATLFYDFNTRQYHPKPAYTFVFSRDTGDPLSGNSAVSASAYSAAGQTGYIHGLLARNLNGLFQPFQTSQQQDSATDAASGPDYLLTQLATQQPADWPELSGTLLNGASSVPGQEAAYHYASYTLLNNYYIKGVSGNYLDDIHYYFTGSNVNYINYHYFDPINLPAPSFTGGQYCWSGPTATPYPAQVCFTPQDFTAVTQQLSKEVVYLTNVMNFMVSGPVNLKNMVATGNSNAGLALTGAATTILSSGLTPATTTTKVTVNASNVLTLVGGIVSVVAGIASDGTITALSPELMKGVNFWGSALGSTLGGGAGIAGGLHTPDSSTTGIPSRFISFSTTVGELANSSLQDQTGIAFDSMLDSVLGDWGKLSILGPKITDSSNPTYYSPNQVAQDAAVRLIAQASQRSFYMSLLPSFYGVYFFPGFSGVNPNLDFVLIGQVTNQPDMGAVVASASNNCNPFFMPGSNSGNGVNNTAPPLGFVWMPTPPYGYVLTGLPWSYIPSRSPSGTNGRGRTPTFSPSDFYVVATNPPTHPGSTQTGANFMSDPLTQQLFTTSGFNIPLDLFVGRFGPLSSTWFDMSSVPQNSNPLGWPAYNICSARPYPITRDGSLPKDGDPPGGGNPVGAASSITTLTAPASIVVGQSVTLQAKVVASGTPLTTGKVIFLQDKADIGTVVLNGTGSASLTVNGLELGTHTLQALYVPTSNYAPSESSLTPLMVYADSADLALSLSAPSLSVTYGTTSSAVKVQIQSLNGMAGSVTLSCSGLPVGMSCSFSPAQTTLTAAGTSSATVTITSDPVKASRLVSTGTAVACILPTGILLMFGLRRGRKSMQQLFCLGVLAAFASALAACGGSSAPKPFQETGAKTVLINVTCGPVTKSIPLVLNIQ